MTGRNITFATAPLRMQGCNLSECSSFDPPGTASRPVLNAEEASAFNEENIFAKGGKPGAFTGPWRPQPVSLAADTPFVVGESAPYHSVQQALNAALRHACGKRVWIKVLPGVYDGVVYIPEDAPPVTIFGAGQTPQAVTLRLALDARFSPARYREAVSRQFSPGDPAWYLYHLCADQTTEVIGTRCSAVVWSQSDDFQLVNLSVVNSLLDSVDALTHQAVALRTDGDRVQLEKVRVISRQDSLWLNTSNRLNEFVRDRISRVSVSESYVEGDVDYVFGRANAVFDRVHFHTVSSRGSKEAYVLAPATLPGNRWGFLVRESLFTGDAGYAGGFKAKLGRAWDQGAGQTGYLPGDTANGQLLIRDSLIDDSYDRLSPWGAAATTARPFRGNVAARRELNDVGYNRLWEFNNRQCRECVRRAKDAARFASLSSAVR